MATRQYVINAVNIWICTAFSEVPKKDFIFQVLFFQLKKIVQLANGSYKVKQWSMALTSLTIAVVIRTKAGI